MRKVLFFLLTILILAGCEANTDDEASGNAIHYDSGTVSVAGCIQKKGEMIFLVNDYDEMLISSNKSDLNELNEEKSYRLRYTEILESHPPTIIVEGYEEINKDYCD